MKLSEIPNPQHLPICKRCVVRKNNKYLPFQSNEQVTYLGEREEKIENEYTFVNFNKKNKNVFSPNFVIFEK